MISGWRFYDFDFNKKCIEVLVFRFYDLSLTVLVPQFYNFNFYIFAFLIFQFHDSAFFFFFKFSDFTLIVIRFRLFDFIVAFLT